MPRRQGGSDMQPMPFASSIRLLTASAVVAALVALPGAFAFGRSADAPARRDPGIRFELDRETYRVHVVDLASGESGPEVPVAIGSPAHPSPRGEYRLWQVVHDPAWNPGQTARAMGARPVPASPDGPLGVAKIPIAGEYALHGGASWLTVGKPVTLGCLRATDEAILALIDWLEGRGALTRRPEERAGERSQAFARPARFVIR